MGLLSLGEPEPVPAAQLTRAESLLISLGVHLLLLFLWFGVPRLLPESVLELLRSAPGAGIASEQAPSGADAPELPRAAEDKIPLEFAYVKIPDDVGVESNPTARLLSDKSRRARQEVPTPPDAALFSPDPHSEGDSIDRVKPDPTVPEGPDSPEPVEGVREPGGGAGESGEERGMASAAEEAPPESSPAGAGGQPAPVPPAGGAVPGAQTAGGGEGEGRGEGPDLRKALADYQAGEYKFTFHNPAYLRGGSYGTLSFDTQDFPWGDYARTIYVIIRNNWFRRIPLAAREGIRGYS
ncbi:MAG: hypothetical protein ACE5JH_10900 [Acidobacteriota bacterium]